MFSSVWNKAVAVKSHDDVLPVPLIFDRRPAVSWEQKLFTRDETWQGHSVTVWGM
jgi:hypothetical protein